MNEGGSVKLPCRAQGRPKPRIIWDRIGVALSQLQQLQQQINEEVSQYLAKDTQEELLAKAKIMSLRSKRSINENSIKFTQRKRSQRKAVFNDAFHSYSSLLSYYNAMERSKRDGESHVVNSNFEQIMRDETQNTVEPKNRKKRQINTDESEKDVDGIDDSQSSNVIPILVFSTQPPQEVSRLQVTDNGELILREVTERDQVTKKRKFSFYFL